MATLKQKIEAEQRMRDLIDKEGLPEPDRVEYGYTCIRLFWEETRTVVVVDIDPPPEGYEETGVDAWAEPESWLAPGKLEGPEGPRAPPPGAGDR
jgi:hypothetical protein